MKSEIVAKIASSVAGLNAHAWDRLAGDDPFVSHAFLAALENSGSVGPGTGWTPAPILIEDDGAHMVAAAPAYLKSHSQGEYVFDHGWAEAWERAGGAYYPKLQVAVPFTPVPGRRLLGSRPQHLLAAIESVTAQYEMSSAHITFIDEAGAAEAERRGWLIREGIQYHWFNRGYSSFDDFLGALTSRRRKAIRKERAQARDGLRFEVLRGAEIGPAEWDAMWNFYQDTGGRKWGHPYLTREFFDLIDKTHGRQAAAVSCLPRIAADRGRTQLHRAGHALWALLGMHRRSAVPALRALLLSGNRMGDRSWSRLRSGRRPGRAQARPRL